MTLRDGRALRVLHVVPCFVALDSEAAGGVANVVHQLAVRQAALGIDVTVYCGTTELGRVVATTGVRVANSLLRSRAFAQYATSALGPIREIRKALVGAGAAFDVAHVHTCFSLFTETAMDRLANEHVPFVFAPHGKLSPGMRANKGALKTLWWRLLARRSVARSARIVALANAERDAVLTTGLEVPVDIIPNGFDRPSSRSSRTPPFSAPYILFLGYLDPRKQPKLLVEAFAASRSRNSHKLVFVGPDKYGHGSELLNLAKHLGVADRILLQGPAYGTEKWTFLENAACLCLPSRGEGLPVVLCEALGAGVPTIYSEHCNFPEIALAGAGLQVKNFDLREWANAIDRVTADDLFRNRLARSALALSDKYTWNAVVARTVETYRAVLGKHTSLVDI
jgi:glycosyltransferase involved in cell wall biosynthesis